MKKIFSVIAIAAMAMVAFSCKEKEDPINDLDNIVEDGVYVMVGGKIDAKYAMAKGINEAASQTVREGMYEKYIVLEKDQEFTLAYKAGDKTVKYGAQLAEFTPAEISGIYADNPAIPVLKGQLIEGDNAPAMKANETGLYHIVLDLNLDKKLDYAQILVAKTQYGVRGGMNSWSFTALEATEAKNDGITFTLTGQQLGNNGEFKFAYNGAWKITLDAAGEVKANTNLGKDCKPGGDNIVVADGAGAYKIELKFKLAAGDVANSWSYTLTQESKADYPEHVYMIGAAWGAWDWASDGVVELQHISAGGDAKDGAFVVTRYFKADDGFKFSTEKDWGKSFAKMGNDPATVTYDGDGNIHVPADGLYTLTLDYTSDTMTLTDGAIYGMGPAFNDDWTAGKYAGVINEDGTASITALSAGALRVYAPCAFDWWQHEFQPDADGKIAYREGAELEAFAVEAGQVITFDFNAGTATVGAGFEPKIAIDGDFSDWAEIEGATNGVHTIKLTSDEKNIYFYSHREAGGRIGEVWNKAGYVYIGIDADGNMETGVELWGNGPYEFVGVFYPYAAEGTFNAKPGDACMPDSFTLANAACAGAYTAEDGATFELSVPRADLPAIPAIPVTVYSWGNKDLSKVSISVTL